MQNPVVFDQKRAASYDKNTAQSAPMFEALRFLTRLVFSGLPEEARILCVGVGTGSELLDLAGHFPAWHFTAVDPAAAMLEICRERAQSSGVAERCAFHEGFLDSLPPSAPFDGATCLMVSHAMADQDERRGFFRQIAARLRVNGILVSSDLAGDRATPEHEARLAVWMEMLRQSEIPAEQVEQYRESYATNAAILPPAEVAALIGESGFQTLVLFFQSLLLHAWFSRRSA